MASLIRTHYPRKTRNVENSILALFYQSTNTLQEIKYRMSLYNCIKT
jgi:hypothetical protein